MNKQTMEKGISDIMGVFSDPILVFPGGWGDTLLEWLKEAITMERLTMNLKALKGEEMTGTDAEACAYLYTASLTQPMDSDWTQIYLYIAGQVAKQHKKAELPQDIVVESISDYQMGELRRLKDWLYHKRTQIRLDRDRAERRQKREEEEAERKAAQPALFQF